MASALNAVGKGLMPFSFVRRVIFFLLFFFLSLELDDGVCLLI